MAYQVCFLVACQVFCLSGKLFCFLVAYQVALFVVWFFGGLPGCLHKPEICSHASNQAAPGDEGGLQRGTLNSNAEARVVLGCADPNRIIL